MADARGVRTGSAGAGARSFGAAQIAAGVVGIVFLLVGALGFIPGITTDYDQMEFAGHESTALLFGVFQVSILHNIVHLLFGVVGVAAATRVAAARSYLAIGGLIYLALWIYGLAVDQDSDANFVPMNQADNWLHLGLGLGMIALALLVWRSAEPDGTPRR
jgi:arginine exporter protein ArgO